MKSDTGFDVSCFGRQGNAAYAVLCIPPEKMSPPALHPSLEWRKSNLASDRAFEVPDVFVPSCWLLQTPVKTQEYD